MNDHPRKIGTGALLLIAAAAVLFGTAPQAGNQLPLVRRDLLRTAAPEFPAIKRDLFSIVSFISPGAPTSRLPLSQAAETDEAEIPEPPPIPVRYVGFIKYAEGDSIVAIVIIGPEVWAATEGQPIGNGWTALRVTEKEIELQNPEGKKLVFLYQGERP